MSKAKAKSDGPKCSAQVYTRIGRWGRFSPCANRGVVERDGKPYCRTHDPEAAKARREEQDAKHQAESDARAERRTREYLLDRLAVGVSTETLQALLDAGRTLAVMLREETP